MEFTQGQVFSMERLSQHIKKTKDHKNTEYQYRKAQDLIACVRTEIHTIKSGLDHICDAEAIEASIYRLKAAELELNRHIRSVKNSVTKG